MKCPYCSHEETQVIDTRETENLEATRRRRECLKCKKRFTTYEKIEQGLRIAAFQLGSAGGKGPIFKVRDFRVPLPQKVDIWGTMTRVHEGTL